MSVSIDCCIAIPVYKKTLSFSETASLLQVFKILNKKQFIFFCPSAFDVSTYKNLFPKNLQISFEYFEDKFFSSVYGYNKLLISLSFYKRFKKYKFILLYQLDAWIFRDELDAWCLKGYDYIGAPWFKEMNLASENSEFLGVGNGGFSLRKVSAHIKALRSFRYLIPLKAIWKKSIKKVSIGSILLFLKNITIRNNTFHLFNDYNFQEDCFWGLIVAKKFKWFQTPDEFIAMQFSMEVNAPLLFKLNKNKLPFGCHAWERYHKSFWTSYININEHFT